MKSLVSFDELNILHNGNYSKKSIPYKEYFSSMSISKEQKEERIKFSQEFENVLLFAFLFIGTLIENGYRNHEYVINQISQRYEEFIISYALINDYLHQYINEFTNNFVETTTKNKDNPYYFSEDRLTYISENEANTVLNYTDFEKAIRAGYKKKIWITEKDKKVRKSHREIEGKEILINDAYLVGNSLMLFPKDTSYGASAEEIVGCRCSIKYKK